ncbi:MAG TPA: hypothetical protein VH136_00580 [Trebonia sp.]|nr:hypothetical protein [Trebonia sp.]
MATLFPDHADLYHTGIVVHDLEKAKAEMSEHLGLTWGVQGESEQPVVLDSGQAAPTTSGTGATTSRPCPRRWPGVACRLPPGSEPANRTRRRRS